MTEPMITKMMDLQIERLDDDNVMLEQDAGCGEVDRVSLHRVQVRYLAEVFDMQGHTLYAPPAVIRLQQQLLTLERRIDHLADWVNTVTDTKHCDLSAEIILINALSDMAGLICDGFRDPSANCPADSVTSASAESGNAPSIPEAKPEASAAGVPPGSRANVPGTGTGPTRMANAIDVPCVCDHKSDQLDLLTPEPA